MRCCVCLRINHRVESCRLLRRAGPGKYCNLCKVYGTHTYSECRQKPYVKHYVNVVTDDNEAYQDDRFSDVWSNIADYQWNKVNSETDSKDNEQTSSDDDQ